MQSMVLRELKEESADSLTSIINFSFELSSVLRLRQPDMIRDDFHPDCSSTTVSTSQGKPAIKN